MRFRVCAAAWRGGSSLRRLVSSAALTSRFSGSVEGCCIGGFGFRIGEVSPGAVIGRLMIGSLAVSVMRIAARRGEAPGMTHMERESPVAPIVPSDFEPDLR